MKVKNVTGAQKPIFTRALNSNKQRMRKSNAVIKECCGCWDELYINESHGSCNQSRIALAYDYYASIDVMKQTSENKHLFLSVIRC